MDGCKYCNDLKEMLVKEGVEFEEVDINLPENKEEIEKVFEICNVDSVPIVKVGRQLLAPEVSFTSINEAFGLTKRFLNS